MKSFPFLAVIFLTPKVTLVIFGFSMFIQLNTLSLVVFRKEIELLIVSL